MTFKTTPYAHQFEAFEKFKDKEAFALFMDMGTGKSKVAIDVCAHKYEDGKIDRCLIIAPNNVHTQWIDEQFPEHCPIHCQTFVWRASEMGRRIVHKRFAAFLGDPDTPLVMKVLAVNVEAFQSSRVIPHVRKFINDARCFIIVDEGTRIKNHTAKRSKMIHKLNKYGQRCILTGTPTAKSPFDLWSMFEFLKGNYFDCNFFIFQHRYGVMMKGVNSASGAHFTTTIDEKNWNIVQSKLKKIKEQRAGELMPDDYAAVAVVMGISERNVRFIASHLQFAKYKDLEKLKTLIADDVYSIRKEECLDLPPKIYEHRYVDPGPEQKKIYKDLREQLLVEYEGRELSVVNKVALTTRLLQICGGFFPYKDERGAQSRLIGTKNVKLEALTADLEEAGDQPIIIWAHFVKEVELIDRELTKLGYKSKKFYGRTGAGSRKFIIEQFNTGEVQVIVGNPSVAGFGLNLQVCTLQYYFSNSFRIEDRLQAEDRSHRIGVESACIYKDIVLKGTIDERVYEAISAGRDMNDFFKSQTLRELLKDEDA